MKKTKIAIITSTRAEYGILYPLICQMIQEKCFITHLIVTGTHLLQKYGNTVNYIENDNIPISYKVLIMNKESNEPCDVISTGINKFNELFEKEKYDAIILLGDRYELFAFSIPAVMHRIPIVHIHGGEKTEGAVDEKIRHSITKLSSIHFPSIEEYAKRIIQMGEQPDFVFPVGALGIDNIMSISPIPKFELEKELNIDFNEKTALVTFHPVTMDSVEDVVNQTRTVFSALEEKKIKCIVTMPNSDMGGDEVYKIIMEYVNRLPSQFHFFKSLGSHKYLSTMNYVSMLVGNTSSGIIEAPSFNIPTINIGDRQKGRFAPKTVITCTCEKEDIKNAIEHALSVEFKNQIKDYKNPYGDGHTADKIVDILKKISWDDVRLLKKEFYDFG